MYSEEIKNNATKLPQYKKTVPSISSSRSTDKKFIPSDSSHQLAAEESSIKEDLIITKNRLIRNLLKKFSFQKKRNKSKAEKTEKEISSLIDEILIEDPDNIYTICYAIKFAKIKGDIAETIRLLQKKLEITPNNPTTLAELKTLQENPISLTINQPDRNLFLSQYKHLKEIGDLEGLESLLRARLSLYPRR